MPRQLNMPTDEHSAIEVMKYFPEMAYMTIYRDIFERAVQILYGQDLIVTEDLSKRMIFSCLLCSKDMNAETALKQHTHSGTHQKNVDKKYREHRGQPYSRSISYRHKDPSYGDPNGLRGMLKSSQIKPVGLQMIEEYERTAGKKCYFKCILCGAHGKLDSIYYHAIGKKHTDKYIKSGVSLKKSILTSEEREVIREFLIKKEGITLSSIKTYREKRLYPYMWEEHSATLRTTSKSREALRASQSSSPMPSTSIKRQRSPSPEGHPWESPSSSSSSSSRIPQVDLPQRKVKETSPYSKHQNQSPSSIDKPKTSYSQATLVQEVEKQDRGVQKYDLEELMIQFNFIVKTSHLPAFDIETPEDAKAALDMMFKISSALHFVTKVQIDNPQDKSKEFIANLEQKKSFLSKIMGSIKYIMMPAIEKEGT